MISAQLKYFPYLFKLRHSIETSNGTIDFRRGFKIELTDEKYNVGIGDCSPFPELGSETFEEAAEALKSISLIKITSTEKEQINLSIKEFVNLPTLHSGLQQAIIDLLVKRSRQTVEKFLGFNLKKEIAVNGLIGFMNFEESTAKAKRLVDNGFSTIKIKTGRSNPEEDIQIVKTIRKTVGASIKLRIDSNGAWNIETAKHVLKQLESSNLEYAEQPVNNLIDFVSLRNCVSVPLAVDESNKNCNDALKFIKSGSVSFLVLKPMLLGGLLEALDIIELAAKENIQCIVTSSFESSVGRKNCVLAAATINNKLAHGLSVGENFEEDFDDSYKVLNGKIKL